MKKIQIILSAFLSFVVLLSCDKNFEELNTDPNNPVAVPAHLLLGYTQRTYTNTIYILQRGCDMGSGWAQHMSKVQYNDEMGLFVPRRGVIDNIWEEIYSLSISEANSMFELAGEEGNTNLQGAALIMQAIGFQTLTDLYGPIPFTEANDPAILQPAYDDESVVYAGVIDMLTEAAGLLSGGSGEIAASSDLFYGGDVSKWRKLANSLKFRALMRISSTRDVSSELQALVSGGAMFSSNDDSAQLSYLAAQPDANPHFETIVFGARPEYKINSVLVELMQGLNDGRLDVYAGLNASGAILGKPSGFGGSTPLPSEALGYTYANISGLGDFYLDPELPGQIMSFSQLNFLLAEAANEGLISGGVAAASNFYEEGIKASFAFNGLDATAYLAQPNLAFTTQADGRTKIGQQAWIALYSQGFEAWTEWRRTKIPALAVPAEAALSQIPTRLYYPTTEETLNKDSYDAGVSKLGGDELTSPLFWQ